MESISLPIAMGRLRNYRRYAERKKSTPCIDYNQLERLAVITSFFAYCGHRRSGE